MPTMLPPYPRANANRSEKAIFWADEQGNPCYVLDLLARIVTVSVETAKIVNALPALEIVE